MKRRLLGALLTIVPASLWAAQHVFLIGGGPTPSASEAQIEYNVKWVMASLRDFAPNAAVTVFFAGGAQAPNTVVEQVPRTDSISQAFEPIALVFGDETRNRLRFRPHTVPNVVASTERDSLLPALTRYLTSLRAGDQAMIIYNGHGSWSPDRADNALRLWKETSLNVREFTALLDKVDPAVPVRFVMTQCYSGAFARAVHPAAEPSVGLAGGQRCGFFAESADRESEGCSASIELGDYRDYTTYFVAGLTGRDRFGQPIAKARDRDADGRVTPFDAHLHTLVEGYNGDLPRSTSEDYLERSLPWYQRWVGTSTVPDNLYGRLAKEMAVRYALPPDGRSLGQLLRVRYDSLQREVERVTRLVEDLDRASDSTRTRMQADLERAWPALSQPYTASYRRLLSDDADRVNAAIRNDPRFRTLLAHDSERSAHDVHLIDLDRRISQLDRLRRARLMARALAQLERSGPRAVQTAYAQLRRCEALPLTESPSR